MNLIKPVNSITSSNSQPKNSSTFSFNRSAIERLINNIKADAKYDFVFVFCFRGRRRKREVSQSQSDLGWEQRGR